jgi:hypothetical protein
MAVFRRLSACVAAAALVVTGLPAASVADVAATGLSMIPADAAFVSSSLRLREQYDAIVSSNAFASLRKLPAVKKFFDSLEEQRAQPGSPLSIVDTFMQLPENQQAVDLLTDMVATDTFVYGEPSWTKPIALLKKVQQAQQAANILGMAGGDGLLGGFDILEALPGGDDDAAAGPVRVQPVRLQMVRTDFGNELASRLILKTIADNKDLIVIPDLVWGFRTTMGAAAVTQLKRLEVLLQLATQANPDLADALERRTIAGGEFVTFTFKPDYSLLQQQWVVDEDSEDDVDAIFTALGSIEVVVAIGTVGDRVILSLGDSTDHLEKLVTANSGFGKGLVGTKPLLPLKDHRDKSITAVSYVSQEMMQVLAPSTAEIDQLATLTDRIAEQADLSAEAAADAAETLRTISTQYRKWLPTPGPWMAYSFISEQGYEGYAWDWSRNGPLDGSKRLDLLEHVGGAPLAAAALRVRTDAYRFDDVVAWADMLRGFATKHLVPQADDDVQERVAAFERHLLPLGQKFVDIVRRTFRPAMAGGQIGFVIDGKSRTNRLQQALPQAEAPLPLVEPAIVIGLDDPALFREGMNDLFALSDELVDAVRAMSPEAVPSDYRIADPRKEEVAGGNVWSWSLEKTGLDEQVQPAIALGKDTAVLSLVPKQAGRLIVETPLTTGAQLTKFEEPLAGAATLDVAGLIEALEPWVIYAARYAAVQGREGSVGSDLTLDADVEDDQAKEILAQVKVVLEAAKSLRVATAETATKPDATVTHWRNVIRDMPQ